MFSIFPKDDYNQTLRIKRFLMAFGSYIMWSTLAIFFYFQGNTRVTFNVLVISLSGILILNILLYTTIRTGFNKRFKDPSMTLLQMIIATFWVMVIVYYAESIRGVVLLIYLVVFVFGLFKLNVLQFLFLSVFAVVNYASVIFLLYKTYPESINTKTDVLYIVILATVLPWFSLVGGYISGLRAKISKDRSTIKNLTDNIQDVIFVLDTNLHYTYVSPSVKIMRGYEAKEVMKQAPFDALTPASMELAMKELSEMIELDKTEHKEDISRTLQLEILRKDDTTVWTETKFSFIRDKNQRPVNILAVMRDITDRKEAEEAIRQGEEKYRNILETIPDVYFEVDLAGNFIFFNDEIYSLYGYSKEELIGMNYRNYTDKEFVEKVFIAFNTVYKTEVPAKGFDWKIIKKDGTNKHVEASATLIKDSSGNPIGFRGIIRDINERKQMEKKLQKTLKSLRNAVGTTIQVMVSAVEVRDPYTAGHQIRTADLARAIAMEMGLCQDKIEGIRLAGSIHDIGKLSIPAEILAKPTKLTNLEFSLIKEHAQKGYEMLKNVESPWPLAQIVYQHHERMNGSGYPRNLKGDEILIEARIMAVSDVVEAMASHRPYRPGLGIEAALEEIEKNKGLFYDDAVADACLKLFRKNGYKFK